VSGRKNLVPILPLGDISFFRAASTRSNIPSGRDRARRRRPCIPANHRSPPNSAGSPGRCAKSAVGQEPFSGSPEANDPFWANLVIHRLPEQRRLSAVSGHSRPRPGTGKFDPFRTFGPAYEIGDSAADRASRSIQNGTSRRRGEGEAVDGGRRCSGGRPDGDGAIRLGLVENAAARRAENVLYASQNCSIAPCSALTLSNPSAAAAFLSPPYCLTSAETLWP
jgi:hypothetical protein